MKINKNTITEIPIIITRYDKIDGMKKSGYLDDIIKKTTYFETHICCFKIHHIPVIDLLDSKKFVMDDGRYVMSQEQYNDLIDNNLSLFS